MKYKNKVIIVTGAGNGIGRALTLQLLEKGASVAAVDINKDFLKETKSLAKGNSEFLSTHVLDVRNFEGIQNLRKDVLEFHGRVDGLINNAGVSAPRKKFVDLPKENADFILDINLNAILNLSRTFLPDILESTGGLLANVSSMAGFLPVPNLVTYVTSKFAVNGFTEAMYNELYDTNVTVCLLLPGAIQTNINQNSGLEKTKPRGMCVDKAARIMLEEIEKKRLKILIGEDAEKMFKLMTSSYDEGMKTVRGIK